jgi:AcrR family transcriptional regulator
LQKLGGLVEVVMPTEATNRADGVPTSGDDAGGRPRRRAEAERRIAAIVDAGLSCLLRDPQASLAAVARAAGVSRVTLYSHFPSREVLLEAVLERSVAQAAEVLEAEALDELPAGEALLRLIRSSWRILDQHSSLFAAVSTALTPAQMRDHHERVLAPLLGLLTRGQAQGAIRDDLPVQWLVTVFYSLIHAAAAEVQARRLPAEAAPDVLADTLLAALRHQPSTSGT